MTFHKVVVESLAKQIPNAVNNHYKESPRWHIDGYIPDLVVEKGGKLEEVHEVECLKNKRYSHGVKRVLWIALEGDGDWDEINVITDKGIRVREVKMCKESLEEEIQLIRKQVRSLRKKKMYLQRKLKRLKKQIQNDYDIKWDLHLMEELRKEVERFGFGGVANGH